MKSLKSIEEYILNETTNIIETTSTFANDLRKMKCLFDHSHFAYVDDTGIISCPKCRYNSNLIKILEKKLNISYEESLKIILEKKLNVVAPDFLETLVRNKKLERKKLYKINKDALYLFKKNINKKIVLDYLKNRNISDEMVKKFHLGYCDKNLILKGLSKYYSNEELFKVGLLNISKEKKYFDVYNNRLIFPIISRGVVVGFGGRTITNATPKYYNTKTTDIFNKSNTLYGLNFLENKKYPFLLCCEGYMDCLSLYQYGITNVVANLGTAITQSHIDLMKKYTDNIVLMLDGDSAGQTAMFRTLTKVEGISTVSLPENLDPDEYIKKYSKEKLLDYIEKNKCSWEKSLVNYSSSIKENTNFFNLYFEENSKKIFI